VVDVQQQVQARLQKQSSMSEFCSYEAAIVPLTDKVVEVVSRAHCCSQ
jgi:lipase chaperone LimK